MRAFHPAHLLLASVGMAAAFQCVENNCLQALQNNAGLASPFCSSLLASTTPSLSPTSVPQALHRCHDNVSSYSSACSCLLSRTATTTSTSKPPSSFSSTSTLRASISTTATSSSTTSTSATSTSRASSASGTSSTSVSTSRSQTTFSSSTRTSTSTVSTSTSSSPASTCNGSIATVTITASATATATTTATTTITTGTTTTITSASTPSSTRLTADINGCPAIDNSYDGNGFTYMCNVNFNPSQSISLGTNPGYSIEDCTHQCFFNVLGGDCLGATYTPANPPFNQLGSMQQGTCELWMFTDGTFAADGVAVSVFTGF